MGQKSKRFRDSWLERYGDCKTIEEVIREANQTRFAARRTPNVNRKNNLERVRSLQCLVE